MRGPQYGNFCYDRQLQGPKLPDSLRGTVFQDSNDLSKESDKPESDTAEDRESTSKHDNKHNEGQSNPKVRSRTDREPAVVSNEADATEILHRQRKIYIQMLPR